MNSFELELINTTEDNQTFKVKVTLPMDLGWYDNVVFNAVNNDEFYCQKLKHIKNENKLVYFEGEITLPTSAVFFTNISLKVNGEQKYLDKNGNITEKTTRKEMKKVSVNFNVPDWAKGQMIYHIYIDRFNRGSNEPLKRMPRRNIHNTAHEDVQIGPDTEGIWNNDFYGGDLKGITQKLNYIKGLGFNILYLSPINRSQSNHGYDTGDYLQIDPYKGTSEDLKELCDKAHRLGMKVILDVVFNHTGNDSIYYNELNSYDSLGAYQSDKSPYLKYYRTHKGSNNEILFEYWWSFKNLPVAATEKEEWQNFICGEGGVVDYYYSLGIDGLRVDVADDISPIFLRKLKKAYERNKKDSMIYLEVWIDPMTSEKTYIRSGKEGHSVMNYLWMDNLVGYYKFNKKESLRISLENIMINYPEGTTNTLMNSTSTHDISRPITVFGIEDPEIIGKGYEREYNFSTNNNNHDFIRGFRLTDDQYKKARDIYESYLYTLGMLPGNLTVFYGDEVGIQGLGNLQNRRPFPWDKIDKKIQRTVRTIGKIRLENDFLREAGLNILDINDKYIMFERKKDEDKILVVVNKSDEEVPIYIPEEYKEPEKVYTLKKSNTKKLAPFGGIIVKK